MRKTPLRSAVVFFCGIVVFILGSHIATFSQVLPNPVLVFNGQEPFKTGGKDFVRYNYFVFNDTSYPAALFAAAPDLPPCGTNTKSSRTWVNVLDQSGRRLNGFCALLGPGGLVGIWFALGVDVIPPSWVYIEMNDRQTDTMYKSNLAETTL